MIVRVLAAGQDQRDDVGDERVVRVDRPAQHAEVAAVELAPEALAVPVLDEPRAHPALEGARAVRQVGTGAALERAQTERRQSRRES